MKQALVLEDFPRPEIARTLSPNGRASHWAKSRAKIKVLEALKVALQQANLQPMEPPIVMRARFTYPVERRRDDDNLATGVLKVLRDGLVKAGVVPEDNTKVFRQLSPEVNVERGVRRLTLELAEAEGRSEG